MTVRRGGRLLGFVSVFLGLTACWMPVSALAATDSRVSGVDHSGLQAESAIAWHPVDGGHPSGLLCATWIDQGQPAGSGSIAFGYSTDSGVTWHDNGALPHASGAKNTIDPDVDYRSRDGKFYVMSIEQFPKDIGVHATVDCVSVSSGDHYHVLQSSGPTISDPDKPMMVVDNWEGSPGYGRLYVAFRYVTHSNIGVSWSVTSTGTPSVWTTPVNPYDPATHQVLGGMHGPWPTVTPNGDLYLAWIRWQGAYGNSPIDIEVSRKSAASGTFQLVTPALLGGVNPHDTASTCTPPALRGKIDLVPSPQIESDDLGYLHLIYVAGDPSNASDHSNIYYKRSTDGGQTWSSPLRLNDDTGNTDQFLPTLLVSRTGNVSVYWYDRRENPDATNPSYRIYRINSPSRGTGWSSNTAVSDVLSPTQPRLGGGCFMGHYNEGDVDGGKLFMIWGDNRNSIQSGGQTVQDPDIWFERVVIPPQFCNVGYCSGVGVRCVNTGIIDDCCSYMQQTDLSCGGPDTPPINSCGCGQQ